MPRRRDSQLAPILDRLALTVALVIVVGLPLGHYYIAYQGVADRAEAKADVKAQTITALISESPEVWMYQSARLEELLLRTPALSEDEAARLRDAKNVVIVEGGLQPRAPTLLRSSPLYDSGRVVGQVEIERSLHGVLIGTALVALLGVLLSALAYASLRILPLRALRRVTADLQQSHDLLAKISEQVPGVIFQLRLSADGKWSFPFISHSSDALYASTPELRQEDGAVSLDYVHAEDRERLLESIRASARTLKLWHQEYRVLVPEQGLRWHSGQARPEKLKDGSTQWHGFLTDITERVRADEARKLLEVQLRSAQKMEAIGTLAAGIAHDFNNILAAILGNAALAKKDVAAGQVADALVSLEEIDKAGGRGRQLVQQILAFSRKQPQDLVIQPLRPLVEDALGLLRATLPAGVEVGIALADVPLNVYSDATQIHQLLMNLCTNAWHALEGRAGRIELELTEVLVDAGQGGRVDGLASGRYARIRVSDNGCGMDEATQARIFEPFYTTKPVDKGTGLGLAVVHGIVKSHQGAIVVESAPRKGTRVDVYLPVAQGGVATEPPATDAPRVQSGAGKHVLYVDDDEAMVFLVKRMLEDLGYRVSSFDRPNEAMEAVRARPFDFDLIVTDFNMPGLSGLEVARELHAIRRELPVVITSGYITEELTAGARAAGVRQVVYKPNTVDELCATIRRLLDTASESAEEPRIGPRGPG